MITYYSDQDTAYNHIWEQVIPLVQLNGRVAKINFGYSEDLRNQLPEEQRNLFADELDRVAAVEGREILVMGVDVVVEDDEQERSFISVHGHIGSTDNPEYCLEVPIDYLTFKRSGFSKPSNISGGFPLPLFGVN